MSDEPKGLALWGGVDLDLTVEVLKQKKCAVCGEPATTATRRLDQQERRFVCDQHRWRICASSTSTPAEIDRSHDVALETDRNRDARLKWEEADQPGGYGCGCTQFRRRATHSDDNPFDTETLRVECVCGHREGEHLWEGGRWDGRCLFNTETTFR